MLGVTISLFSRREPTSLQNPSFRYMKSKYFAMGFFGEVSGTVTGRSYQ